MSSNLNKILLSVFETIQICAVPIFFAISGAMVFVSLSKRDVKMWKFFKEKAQTLILPFLVLNFIACLIGYFEIVCGIKVDFSAWLGEISLESFFKAFGIGRTRSSVVYSLWYLRCLFLLILIAPFLKYIIIYSKKATVYLLIILLLACFWWIFIDQYLFPLTIYSFIMSPFHILHFICGMIWAYNGFSYPKINIKWLICIPILYGIFSQFLPQFFSYTLKMFIVIPVSAVALFSLISDRCWSHCLVRNSFGIYVFHLIVIHLGILILLLLGCRFCAYTFIHYVLYAVVVLLFSLIGSECIHRFYPRLVAIVFGGR